MLAYELPAQLKTQFDFQPTGEPAGSLTLGRGRLHAQLVYLAIIARMSIKVRPHAAGARGGNQGMSLSKGGLTPRYIWPWMRLLCRSESLLQTVPVQIARRLSR